MDTTLFNFHDIILLLTAFQCIAVAAFLFKSSKSRSLTFILLIAFFLVRASISLHELILWGVTFRHWVLELSPNLFFVFNFSYCLDGPLLYFYCLSLVNSNFSFKKTHLLHALPSLFLMFFIFTTFYLLPFNEKVVLIEEYSFQDLNFAIVDLAVKSLRIVYIGLAIRLIYLQFKETSVKPLNASPWLLRFLIAFVAILSLEALLSVVKVYHEMFWLDHYAILATTIGVTDYYLLFGLINIVIYLSVVPNAENRNSKQKAALKEPINMDYVEKLTVAMEEDKIYLNHNLSIERLSEKLGIPLKDLSNTINRHYNINFYEFLNNYRIKEAEIMLADPENKEKSITDIFLDAGFNSKSVYNTLFKKKFNQTPSQYRKSLQKLAK